MPKLSVQRISHKLSELKVIGHIDDVIEGRCPEELEPIEASSFRYAFELGSPFGKESMGEMIAFDGTVYARTTDTYTVQSGPLLYTTGALIIPHEGIPGYHLKGRKVETMADLYEQIYEQAGYPCAFVGRVHFKTLEGAAIARAPIHGENIFDHREAYYPHPPSHYEDVSGFLMGMVSPEPNEVLYRNPFEKPQALYAHTHILIDDPVDLLHLFPSSEVVGFDLELYPTSVITSM